MFPPLQGEFHSQIVCCSFLTVCHINCYMLSLTTHLLVWDGAEMIALKPNL